MQSKVEAGKVAKKLDAAGYHSIMIVQDWSTKEYSVVCMNRCWIRREYSSLEEAKKDAKW
jgi:hypothetical protein